MNDYAIIGIVGLASMSLLALVVLWRMIRFAIQTDKEDRETFAFKKKLFFHLLLLLTPLTDIPLYIAFILYGRYTIASYSFHKLETALLFAAFSLTISDWSVVLYQIQEYKLYSFLFQRASLISINILYSLISLINFIFCYTLGNLQAYLDSYIYLVGMAFQVLTSFLLVSLMLSFGLKLSFRIRGAAGAGMNNSSHEGRYDNSHRGENDIHSSGRNAEVGVKKVSHGPTTVSDRAHPVAIDKASLLASNSNRASRKNTTEQRFDESRNESAETNHSGAEDLYDEEVASATSDPSNILSDSSPVPQRTISVNTRNSASNEFRSALWNLNAVMATCTFCLLLQIILLILNYALGYSTSSNAYVGPEFFYWTCYNWLPLWGPILALLYLCRAHSSREAKEKKRIKSHHSSTTSGARSGEVRSNSSSFGAPWYNPVYSASINEDTYDEILTNSNLSAQLLEEDHLVAFSPFSPFKGKDMGSLPHGISSESPSVSYNTNRFLTVPTTGSSRHSRPTTTPLVTPSFLKSNIADDLKSEEANDIVMERNDSLTSEMSSYSLEESEASSHGPFSRMRASIGSRDTLNSLPSFVDNVQRDTVGSISSAGGKSSYGYSYNVSF